MSMEKKLGEQLKRYREKVFKDQALRRVADQVGVNYSYLYRLEEGSHVPSDEILLKLAAAYNLKLLEKLELFAMAHSPEFRNLLSEASVDATNPVRAVFYRKGTKK